MSTLLLAVRGYGPRAFRSTGGTLLERLERFGFTRLAEVPGEELVFGIAGRFWRPSGDLRRLPDAEAFGAFAEDGCVKAAWNLRIAAVDGDGAEVSTETRIAYYGDAARRSFRCYWLLVGPFSGMLRRALLRDIARRAELH